MRTDFTPAQLADPDYAESHGTIRKCVHCGFCTATCPTYVLLGDERDSPRGRIELIRAMLKKGGAPSRDTVTHIDRCLSCLACATTCPSGVDYGQLIGHARAYVEANYRRPWPERILRALIPAVMTRPGWLRAGLALGRAAQGFTPWLERLKLSSLVALLRLVPAATKAPRGVGTYPAVEERRGRVILLQGCVGPAMAPQVREAAIRLLAEAGYDVREVPEGHLCCGSAGVYNILQPGLATQLRDRKAANIARTGAVVVAAGNVGCMAQIAPALSAPVVHPVELLDWATGGPRPEALDRLQVRS